MASDYFLKIDGIQGESSDAKHKNEIEIESWTWGAANAGSQSGGGGGKSTAVAQDFHFVMQLNRASPSLLEALFTGKVISSALLTARRAGAAPFEYLKVKLTDVLVSSFQTGGSADAAARPLDQASLSFAKLEFEYTEQKPDGSAGPQTKFGWDLKSQKNV